MSTSDRDTLLHKQRVLHYINIIIQKLIERAETHDDSKLCDEEVLLFDEYTPKLKSCSYNSPEYQEFLKKLKPALDHHYAKNRHHPEHFPNGVKDMTLVDIIEMLADWKASSERHTDGNILKSISINRDRFEYSAELEAILNNTVKEFE